MKTIFVMLMVVVSASTHAALITYSSRANFESATGATGVGPIPGGAGLGSVASFSMGGLTFTNEGPPTINIVRNWSTLISEPFDLAINGVEQFNIDSATDLYSFGFDFHEPSLSKPPNPPYPDTCNMICVDSTFELTLLHGLTSVGVFEFIRPDDSLEFVGAWSSNPFNRIEIRELVGNADNEFFGNFSTGTVAAVPGPGTFSLLVVWLLGVLAHRQKLL